MNTPTFPLPFSEPIHIAGIQARAYEVPIAQAVRTSFGKMHARPAVFVRVVDSHGQEGWGEVWCNFPPGGAAYKRHLVNHVFAPMLEGRSVDDPRKLFDTLTRATDVLGIQCGEPGPLAHCIAGIDIALWDLAARRAGLPLWKLLGGRSSDIAVYASGINPDRPADVVQTQSDQGHRAFKLKIGFGEETDIANLRAIRDAVGSEAPVMADANQAWDVDTAEHMISRLKDFGLDWIEEPLRADRPWQEWRRLLPLGTPLAAGENVMGASAFDDALQAGSLSVVQPDVAKWGGFSGCLPVATRILSSGRRYCPHFLGGGIGLLASAHLLAAAGGDGMLEIDANPNPLRTLTCGPLARPEKGRVRLDDAAGLGHAPDFDQLREYEVAF